MRAVAQRAPGAPAQGAVARGDRVNLRRPLAALALATLAGTGCTQSRAERQKTVDRAGQVDQTLAASAVVRDLRAPSDTGGVIYSPPTNLAQQPAVAAGSPPTMGASVPDSAHAKRPGTSTDTARSR